MSTIIFLVFGIVLATAGVIVAIDLNRDIDQTLKDIEALSPEQAKELWESWKSQGFIR